MLACLAARYHPFHTSSLSWPRRKMPPKIVGHESKRAAATAPAPEAKRSYAQVLAAPSASASAPQSRGAALERTETKQSRLDADFVLQPVDASQRADSVEQPGDFMRLPHALVSKVVSFLSVSEHLNLAALLCRKASDAARSRLSWATRVDFSRCRSVPAQTSWLEAWGCLPSEVVVLSAYPHADARAPELFLRAAGRHATLVEVRSTHQHNKADTVSPDMWHGDEFPFLQTLRFAGHVYGGFRSATAELPSLERLEVIPAGLWDRPEFVWDARKLPRLQRLDLTVMLRQRMHPSVLPILRRLHAHADFETVDALLEAFPHCSVLDWLAIDFEHETTALQHDLLLRCALDLHLPLRELSINFDLHSHAMRGMSSTSCRSSRRLSTCLSG